jgi:FkbM family methyltransferase
MKHIFIEVLLDDCYGTQDLHEPVETVLDIGANVGLFSVAARMAFPRATIHSYEPNSRIQHFLRNQAEWARFTCYLESIGKEEGKATLEIGSESGLTRSRLYPNGEVLQTSFQEAVARLGGRVDLVKMDCEGAEWDILQDTATWAHVRNLAMEYHLCPSYTHDDALRICEQLGFRIRRQVRNKLTGLVIASQRKGQ